MGQVRSVRGEREPGFNESPLKERRLPGEQLLNAWGVFEQRLMPAQTLLGPPAPGGRMPAALLDLCGYTQGVF